MNRKFIFVVGGVMSGVGKGVTSASIGKILQARGYNITAMKIDPYVNVDAGTMNPIEHGEVFVTVDGDETDQDLGNYERFLDKNITSVNYMTTGRIYQTVIQRERNLEYDGKCVQVVPHIPEEVIRRIEIASESANADITVIEIGGTVGEYENLLFLEAVRMLKFHRPKDVSVVLVSYLPIPKMMGEMKTKPTQHAARALNSTGLQADFIICRAEEAIDEPRRAKIALMCNIQPDHVISAPDADSVYEVPLIFESQNLDVKLLKELDLDPLQPDMQEWRELITKIKLITRPVKIAVLGKYFGTGNYTLSDSYISVIEAAKHASWANDVKPEFTWIDSESYAQDPRKVEELRDYDGVIVPGGFGSRGIEGIIRAIQFLREQKIPYLGLCYGMQLATIEFARNVAHLQNAHSTEVDNDTPHPVIHVMPDQEKKLLALEYGGTMRLGAYPCRLKENSIVAVAYEAQRSPSEALMNIEAKEDSSSNSADASLDTNQQSKLLISERHRHRYEFNNAYRDQLENSGLIISGTSPDGRLAEVIELPREIHPFFVASQYHPEFQSRPLSPHPLFKAFIKAAVMSEE